MLEYIGRRQLFCSKPITGLTAGHLIAAKRPKYPELTQISARARQNDLSCTLSSLYTQ